MKARFTLRQRLVLSHVVLGLLVVLGTLFASHVAERRAEEHGIERTKSVQEAQVLAPLAAGAAGEGFAYVVGGGNADERQRTLATLTSIELRCALLAKNVQL